MHLPFVADGPLDDDEALPGELVEDTVIPDEIVTNDHSEYGRSLAAWPCVTTVVCESPFAHPGLVPKPEGAEEPPDGAELPIVEM